MYRFFGDRVDPGVAEPCFGTAHGLKQLRAGGARLTDDVECLVPPVGGHLAAPRVGILGRTDRGEQHLGGSHPEAEQERGGAIVGIEPVVRGAEGFARRDQHPLVTSTRDLKEDLVLPLELDLLIVDAPRQEHQPIHVEQIGLGQGFGGPGAGLSARRHGRKIVYFGPPKSSGRRRKWSVAARTSGSFRTRNSSRASGPHRTSATRSARLRPIRAASSESGSAATWKRRRTRSRNGVTSRVSHSARAFIQLARAAGVVGNVKAKLSANAPPNPESAAAPHHPGIRAGGGAASSGAMPPPPRTGRP